MSAAEEFRNRGRELMANRTAVEHVPATQVRVVNERRDPTGATLPVTTRYSRPGAPMISEWNAEQAYRLAYFSNVIVYRCMQILADTVAGCPFRAGDAPPIEPGAPTKHNVNARLAQLLGPPPGGPIPNKLTARRLWAWTVVQRKLTGRHGWEIEADPGTGEIVALWPLVSSEINPIPTVGGAEWFSAFEYGQDPKSKKPKTLKPDQILYGWNPSATDFRQPESCLQAARLDVSIAVMLARYNLAFLKNDARPAAVVVTEAFESDEAFYAFKAQWGGQYGGPDNAGKVAFVETSDDPDSSTPPLKPSEAIGFATLGLSQRDAMFMEQEKASLERVAMACGVPWSRLSATDRCVDDETEALTQRGWVSGADMTTEDTILSMDVPTGRLTWSPVREIYRAHYSGPMYRLKHKHADFLVTPGHNWATTDGRLVHVEDLTRSTTIRAMGEPEDSNDDEVYSSAFVELVGWAVTEGCYDSLSYVRLCQNEGPNADRIRAVLNVTGAQWSEGRQKDRPLMRFYLRGEIARAVTAVSPGKIMTPEFLVALTAKQRELLLQTMIDADGARQSSTASWIFTQRDKRAAEAFSMLAALAGYTTSMRHEVSTPGFMRWRVIVRQRKVMTVRRNTRTVEHYDGTVWCPRTDFGTFVARRHGRVIVTGNTYDNAGQEDSNFWMDTMLPLLSDLADEVNMQLAPRLGREVGWFDLSHVKVFKATRTTLAIDPVNLYKSAVALKNEARDMVGLPPLDGGDVFITPEEAALMAGPAPVPIARESFAELQQAVALPTAAEIATLVAAQMRVVPDVEHRDSLAALPPIEQRVVDPDEVEQRRAVIWKATNATVRTFEKQWATAMQRLFTRQRKQVLSRLEGRTGRGNIGQRVAEGRASTDDVFDPDYWAGETTDAVEPLYSNVTAAALGKMADVFGVAFDLEAAFVTDFIQARANKLAGQVTDTTYTAIRDAMSEGTQAGETIAEIADRVRAVFDLADAVRAETIARTEVNSAYGGSTRLASEALPADVLGGFQWIATRDGRTRDDHADADGQTVGPDGTFDVGGEQLEYPGDPAGDPANTVNCRCVVGSTLVSSSGVLAASRRWLDGDVVHLRTALGHELTITPNHPVLRPSGWVPAGSLHIGDDIVSSSVGDWAANGPDIEHPPTRIDQLFDATALTGSWTKRAGRRGVDFYGDGTDSEVEVATADRMLAAYVEATCEQERLHLRATLSTGQVSSSDNASDLCGVAHAESHRLATPAPPHPGITQSDGDDVPRDAVRLGQRLLGLTSEVARGDDIVGQSAPLAARGDGPSVSVAGWPHDVSLFEHGAESGAGGVVAAGGVLAAHPQDIVGHSGLDVLRRDLVGDVPPDEVAEQTSRFELGAEPTLVRTPFGSGSGGRHPVDVVLDSVVDVSVRRFVGHVFDLQTVDGWFVAEGIVLHNCTMVALTPDDMDGRARVSIEHAAAVLGGLRGPVDELALRRVLRGQRALPAPVEPSVDQQTAPMPPIHLTINMPDQPPVNVQVDPAQVNVTVEPPPPAEVNVQVDAPEVNVTMPPERAKVAVRDPETGAVLRWEPEAS